MERSQFTFYESFFKALGRIKSKAARADAYDAICRYALYGEEPDLDGMPDSAAIAFELIRPNLDSSRRKSESGKTGGSRKQTESKQEANGKQTESKKEDKIENKKENKIEYECISAHARKQTAKNFGRFGWVKLTGEEFERLTADLGEAEVNRCIAYIDESAQATGNKNKWKDWNLVIRKCSRERWGMNESRCGGKKEIPKGSGGPCGTANGRRGLLGSYMQVDVKCPFYRGDDGANRVVCEGLVGDERESNITAFFRKKEDFLTQMRVFCCDKYEFCEICAGLRMKYDEEE